MTDRIIAGIVTYNPEIEVLKNNIQAISNQVYKVVVIDNGSGNVEEINSLLRKFDNVVLYLNHSNKGIAYALNQIGDIAVSESCDYFLTLDQDSLADEDLIEKYRGYLNYENLGMICPYVNTDDDFVPIGNVVEVSVAITSGCLTSTKLWLEIGGFWDFLFIDEVDYEFCYQIHRKGKKIIRVNNTSIKHIVGDPVGRRFFGHFLISSNHSAFRRYYIARNNLIIAFLFPEEKEPEKHRYRVELVMIAKIIICEQNRISKIVAMIKGIISALIWKNRIGDIQSRRSG